MRSDQERLLDILEAIGKIRQRVSGDVEAFADDEMLQVWALYHLQIIGEAAHRLSSHLKARYPGVPWNQIGGMRHVLVHGYFAIDLDIVWAAIVKDLPPLESAIQTILEDLASGEP